MPLSNSRGCSSMSLLSLMKKVSSNILEVIYRQAKSPEAFTEFVETMSAGRSFEPLKSVYGKMVNTISPCLNILNYFFLPYRLSQRSSSLLLHASASDGSEMSVTSSTGGTVSTVTPISLATFIKSSIFSFELSLQMIVVFIQSKITAFFSNH